MLLSIFLRLQSLFVSIIILFTTLFSTGKITNIKKVEMPEMKKGEYGQWVDQFIGTGGYPWQSGNTFAGAVNPFGAVKLAPDTCLFTGGNLFGWGISGYYYGDSHILGFSHTRLSGAGVSDMGHFRVTPSVGDRDPAKRRSNPLVFSSENEQATAGYYSVYLAGIDCMAELTSTNHVGVQRYTFGNSKDAHVFIDSTSFLKNKSAKEGVISVDPQTGEITGQARVFTSFSGRYGGLMAYFAAEFDTEFESFSTWVGKESVEGREYAEGDDCGANLNFGNVKGQPIELKLAISFVSVENAKENLKAEADGLDFDDVRDLSIKEWDSYLSRIDISTADDEVKTNFYSAMYHSMIMPTNYTDTNGEYLGFDGEVSKATGFTYRSDMSLWDTFRTTHPLYTLIAPEIQKDSLNSLVAMAKAGGVLPRWPSGNGYTSCMFGTSADMVIAESYLKGITDFDVEAAYEYMKLTSDQAVEGKPHRNGINDYNTLGYVTTNNDKSVSRTLEYCWADNSIALLAQKLGKSEEAEHYLNKSKNYKNLFDGKTKYFRGKSPEGKWSLPFSPRMTTFYDEVLPIKFADAYCEGSAAQWRWSVPQDAKGLISLFGSEKYFVCELEKFMAGATEQRGAVDPGGMYWIGNEHGFHVPYLFNDANRPDLTQKWIRWTLEQRFSSEPNGLDGNDDAGAMSSWYIWSSMGIYPVAGTDEYWIGSPSLDSAVLSLGNGKTLKIEAQNQSSKNVYVKQVTINGQIVDPASRFTHEMIKDGGTITFVMSSTPL